MIVFVWSGEIGVAGSVSVLKRTGPDSSCLGLIDRRQERPLQLGLATDQGQFRFLIGRQATIKATLSGRESAP